MTFFFAFQFLGGGGQPPPPLDTRLSGALKFQPELGTNFKNNKYIPVLLHETVAS